MRLARAVKPISFVKSHAAELLLSLEQGGQPIVITRNGEAKAVLQGIHEYEETQQALAMLKILALSGRDREQGRVRPAAAAFGEIRKTIESRRRS
jgi:prevent-host-death family protein